MADVASGGQSFASSTPETTQLDMDGPSHTQHVVTFPPGTTGGGLQTGSQGSPGGEEEGVLQTGLQLLQAAAAEPVLQPQALPPSSDSTDVQSMRRSQAAQQQQYQPQQRSHTLADFANSLPEELYQFEQSEEQQHVASGEAGASVGSSTKHEALPGHHGKDSEAVQQQAAASVGIDTSGPVSGGNRPEAQQAARPWEAVLTPYKASEEHVEALFQCPLTKVSHIKLLWISTQCVTLC